MKTETIPFPYTKEDLETKVKPGSFLYPYCVNYKWTAGSGWGSEDKTLERTGLLNYHVAVAPPRIISNQVLRSQLKTLIPDKKGEITTYHMGHMSLRNLILGQEDILKVKYGMPIGIYLGRLISVDDTKRVRAQILTLDGQMAWF